MADTAALVVALSAQLTKFEKDMRAAGIMADKAVNDIEDKFSRMNPQVNASFFGNLFSTAVTKGIEAASAAIKEMIDRFQDLQKTADYTASSMEFVYGLQEAFKKVGGSVEDVNAAFKSVAFQLDEIKRGGDNALKTLLAAPGNQQFLKGFNVQTATAEETMKRILVIIGEMPNMIRSVDVGKNLGVPASLAAAAFKEGGEALNQQATAAAAAAPDLQRIANSAALFDGYMKSAVQAIKAWITDSAWDAIKSTVAEIVHILSLFQKGGIFTGGPLEDFGKDALKNLEELQTRMNQFGPEKPNQPKRVIITGGTAEDPFARKTGGGGVDTDFLAKQNDQIEKHIGLMQADAEAAGLGVAKREELRTMSLLLTAAEKDHVTVTEELRMAMQVQAEQAGRAAQALAEATYKVQQLNAASQQIGSALSTAFSDAILEGKKLNEVLASLLKSFAKMAINAAVMAPFTPGAGGGLSPFASLFSGLFGGPAKAAGGTSFAAGGMTLVGEQGPELVNLPRGAQVIPNDVLKGGVGASSIIYSPAIDARGASVEAVARLAQIMEADRASFATRTVATIQNARRSRVPGV